MFVANGFYGLCIYCHRLETRNRSVVGSLEVRGRSWYHIDLAWHRHESMDIEETYLSSSSLAKVSTFNLEKNWNHVAKYMAVHLK